MKENTDFNFPFLWEGEQSVVGRVRKANEDSKAIFTVANMRVFLVCDGMGGHVGGKVASETAIAAIEDFLLNNICIDPREAIHNSIIAANRAILHKAAQQPELSGMGSTCVMLVVTSDGKAYYGHVGDSRIYIVKNSIITQLTKDHSFVQSLVDAGQITKEQAESHPRRNEITNALGLPNMQPPTICYEPIEPDAGDCFLLCSDGLTGMIGDEQIRRVVSKHEIPIQQRTDKLVEMANAEHLGKDNITVELVEFTYKPDSDKKPATRKKPLFYILPALVVLVLGGLAWYFLTSKPDIPVNDTQQEQSVTLKDSVEYKSDKWISLGMAVQTAVVDSAFQQFLRVKALAKNATDISFEWTGKEFSGKTVTVLGATDKVIYRITVPVKYPKTSLPAFGNNDKPDANNKEPQYITISDTVFLNLNEEREIRFTDFTEISSKKIKLDGSEITSSENAIKITKSKVGKDNKINIKWTEGEAPPAKVAFTVKGTDRTTYVITLHLKKYEKKKDAKPSLPTDPTKKNDSVTQIKT